MSTYTQRRIVAAITEGNRPAIIDIAAAEAARRRLPLSLLQAHPDPEHGGARTGLTAVLRQACATWPDLVVTGRNVTGEPGEVLIEASRSATLVVVAGDSEADRRAARPAPAPAPAPVWARVAAHSHCPTLVVPPLAQARPEGPVLLGVGMSGDDDPMIDFAFEEAYLRRVPLLAAHVWSGIPDSALGAVSPYAYDLPGARAVADRALAETLAGWAEKYPDVRVDRMPLYDPNPARTMRDASTLAGLIVVGARRHGRRSSQLLGTVTRALLQHAGCPVAVVRTGNRGRPDVS
jgi:nucleotide-binding universal stress UspA family protein